MGKFSALSDASRTIVNLLKAELEGIVNPENIGVCDPRERTNFTVGIHLYDLQENGEFRETREVVLQDGSTKPPPTSLSLYIVISVASKAELPVRAFDEQRILGKVIQTLNDYGRLPEQHMPEALRQAGETITIELLSVDLEEKIKIWSLFGQPYKPSCFYRISPVLIESAIVRKPKPKVRGLETQIRRK